MELKLFTVDSFTSEQFCGNVAAVCLLEEELDENICQKIAFELNLSETAFVRKLQTTDSFEASSKFALRWFTPVCEVSLCGHATLSSAHVLFKDLDNPSPSIEFETRESGILTCTNCGNGRIGMDFPLYDVSPLELRTKEIDLMIQECTQGLPVKELQYSHAGGYKILIVVLDDKVTRTELESVQPNGPRLLNIDPEGDQINNVDITLKGSKDNGCIDSNGCPYDFVSRVFSPYYGPLEDPVTGSAHCAFGKYWSEVLNKNQLYARQASKRGGELYLNVDREKNRIEIQGNSVSMINGKILF